MLTMYLSHPKTRKSALLYLSVAKRDNPNSLILHIVLTSTIVAAIIAPLAIIDLIVDTFRFTLYEPPKQEPTDEQK